MENELDPRLQQMLKAYSATPKRDPRAARRNQERFVTILNIIFEEQVAPKPAPVLRPPSTWNSFSNQLRKHFANSNQRRSILIGLAVLIVLTMFLFGGIGITAYAASSSLPGDTLYSLKTTAENIRVGLTSDSVAQARLYLEYAGRRLSEIQSLIDEDRHNDVPQAAREFESDIQKALSAIGSLSQTDPTRAIQLKEEVPAILRSYSDILTQMLASLPADIQPALQNAINGAQSGASLLDVEDDDHDDEDDSSESSNIEGTSTAISSSNLPASTSTVSPGVLPTNTPVSSPTSTAIILVLPTSTPPSLPASTSTSPVIQGGDATCQGPLGAVTVDNLFVPKGGTCSLDGTTIRGTIRIEAGASLTARQITVFGNIQADGANYIEVLMGSSVGGSIQIKQGGGARIESATVNGDMQFESNNSILNVSGNQVGGNVQVFKNAGGVTIANNIINGNLQCKENNPAPSGGNNSVQGNKEDQCAGL